MRDYIDERLYFAPFVQIAQNVFSSNERKRTLSDYCFGIPPHKQHQ